MYIGGRLCRGRIEMLVGWSPHVRGAQAACQHSRADLARAFVVRLAGPGVERESARIWSRPPRRRGFSWVHQLDQPGLRSRRQDVEQEGERPPPKIPSTSDYCSARHRACGFPVTRTGTRRTIGRPLRDDHILTGKCPVYQLGQVRLGLLPVHRLGTTSFEAAAGADQRNKVGVRS